MFLMGNSTHDLGPCCFWGEEDSDICAESVVFGGEQREYISVLTLISGRKEERDSFV